MSLARYHVKVDGKRTTITLAPVVAELLTLKLGEEPGTKEGRAQVRRWIQAEIDRDPGAVRYGGASQRLAHRAILTIAAPALIAQHDKWHERLHG